MKKITILLLHMRHGGIEKQSINFANELCKKYKVEIISCYDMLSEPAYRVNENIEIKYLMHAKPNKEKFKQAIREKKVFKVIKEGIKAIKILYNKKHLMKKAIKNLETDFVISTRIEYANLLSKYADKKITTITQEHLHNDSKKYINKVKKSFKNLDYLVVLSPGSKENYAKWLYNNKKIKIVEIPNILTEIPKENSKLENNNIVSVGRLHKVKDFETLINVFLLVHKEVPDCKLTIVGGGDEYETLNLMIEKLNLESFVKITGMVGESEVRKYMLRK